MGVCSPSKFTHLRRLEQILQDHCIGKCGKEYSEYELREMILEKKVKQAEKFVEVELRKQRSQFSEITLQANVFSSRQNLTAP